MFNFQYHTCLYRDVIGRSKSYLTLLDLDEREVEAEFERSLEDEFELEERELDDDLEVRELNELEFDERDLGDLDAELEERDLGEFDAELEERDLEMELDERSYEEDEAE